MMLEKKFSIDEDTLASFKTEMDAIGQAAKEDIGPQDRLHLNKFVTMSRVCTISGLLIGLYSVNIFAIFLISLGNFARWIAAHHITHRGYDSVPGIPRRFKSEHFAKGWRRFIDWFDWMYPPAWNIEHNILHHYSLNELRDPDLVIENIPKSFEENTPRWLRVIYFIGASATWKFIYYAPSTWKQYLLKKKKSLQTGNDNRLQTSDIAKLYGNPIENWRFYAFSVLPYPVFFFLLIPALAGIVFSWNVAQILFWNLILAELVTNIHSFAVIVTNHAGEDLYRFDSPTKNKGEFYLRQVLGSVNFKTGGDLNDFMHGWLNYQIEHHLFPDLTMLQYQKIQPKVKALCAKYEIPYQQQSVFLRVKVLFNIYTKSQKSMKLLEITSNT